MRRAIFFLGGFALVILAFLLAFHPGKHSPGPPVRRLPIKRLDPWILQSNDPDDPYGTYLGNGHIAARIGAEGVGRNGPCLMSGLYEGEALKPLPIWSDFLLYDEKGRRFELDREAPYRQTLNMREGCVETELTLKAGEQRLKGKVIFFIARCAVEIPLAHPTFGVIRYELTPTRSGVVLVKDQLMPGPEWKGKSEPLVEKEGKTTFLGRTASGDAVAVCTAVVDRAGLVLDGRIRVSRGNALVLTKYASASLMPRAPSDALKDFAASAWRMVDDARGLGFERLLGLHTHAWKDIWKSDIVIDGDPEAQQVIHAMMFYLLSSASSEWSIPPTGLSSGAWRGHIFWDADTWMLPALVLQHPDLAQGIVRYRLSTLAGARENAKRRGLSGADFAWESARSGRETVGSPFCDERHITADVAIASDLLSGFEQQASGSAPVKNQLLLEAAACWASRAKCNKAKDRYEILNVLPPDEDVNKTVSNSAYTNAAAKRTLELAAESARRLGRGNWRKWEEIARRMYIPFDEKNRRFVEYEGYSGKKTKQADTELLIYPLVYPMPEDVKRNTFDYYKTRTDPRGPAMTSSIHAIIAAELGRHEEAYQHFLASYRDFLRGPFLMFNEKRSKTYENMCFLTGCAGTIQSVLYGFAGLRIGRHPPGFERILPDLYIKPCLPAKWKKIEIRNLQWRGKAYDLTILPGNKWRLREQGTGNRGRGRVMGRPARPAAGRYFEVCSTRL